MKGLIIWAHDNCRSTLGLYLELLKAFDIPSKINIVHKSGVSMREKVGFQREEFTDEKIFYIEDDERKAIGDLSNHKDWNHLFASYQKNDIFRMLMDYCVENKIIYAIMSEAPCNMEANPLRRLAKSVYMSQILKNRVSPIINHADFIVNYSGYYKKELKSLGWSDDKIVSFGYFPPPIPNGSLVKRNEKNWSNFTILLSGIHQWHRSPMVLLKAILLLKKKGLNPKCYITQEGPLLQKMKNYTLKHNLDNVEFLGFVAMDRLIELYETCSMYVGAGSHEPWGMRLNDVLQCGAPLLVSRGMGGVKMVDDYGCGLAFERNDYKGLADKIESLISDKSIYLKIATNAFDAASKIAPSIKAKELANKISSRYPLHWKI